MPATRAVYLPPWRIDVTSRSNVPVPLSAVAMARTAARALAVAGAPLPASLGLILTDDAELAALNEQHMGEHGPTDVLSFPMLPPSAFPAHTSGAAHAARSDRDAGFVLPPGRRPHLGDVVVSVERAIDQASSGRGGQSGDLSWSAADELRLLTIHGVLHVCGWDHADPRERDAMRLLESQVLAARRPMSSRRSSRSSS